MKKEELVRRLEQSTGKFAAMGVWAVGTATLFLLASGIMYVFLALELSSAIDARTSSLIDTWLNGVDSNETYQGIYIAAVERLSAGAFLIICSIVMAIMTIAAMGRKRLDLKILRIIKELEKQP